MRRKNTSWSKEEDAILAQAVKDKVSVVRLSIRLRRSEGSIKRRMRELGLAGVTKTSPATLMHAKRWLAAARTRDLKRLVSLYTPNAMLECRCTGTAAYVGHFAIQEYWSSKLGTSVRNAFSFVSVRKEGDQIALDYLSYEGKPVRVFMAFENGKIVRSECGPRRVMQAA
jgi:hypothetical protein